MLQQYIDGKLALHFILHAEAGLRIKKPAPAVYELQGLALIW
ncbi:hypothetical protein [Pontibacter akesuensis]|uniref:Uncharacterized protein n=1 Tax=Pontibacter akesuensis TaxID=388950 RepID=A0A1I7G7Q8_9BACT|nr:hypothetical protein [Pontibacter akesuensis]SFU44286.1 hypothetical protein SAMN04487941_0778 [Pontibacter akesuensis]